MYSYKVANTELVAPKTLLLTLKNTEPSRLFTFRPGQYVSMSFKRHGRSTPERCFSIVSSPTEQETLQVSMRIKGRYTTALSGIKVGDPVSVRGPFGSFVFDADQYPRVVLLAGGIGVTPLMSMANFATKAQKTNEMIMFFSCQTAQDVPFYKDLVQLQKDNPRFKVVFVIGEGDVSSLHGQTVAQGRITPELLSRYLGDKFADTTYFICGPPGFMKGMKGALLQKSVDAASIKTEAFSQGPVKQTGKLLSWPYNIYALSALGMVLGTFAITVVDLLKTLPPLSSFVDADSIGEQTSSSLRQDELDKLVNAKAPTVSVTKVSAQTVTQKSTTTSSSSSTGKSITTPKPKPKPAPAPVCTTNASGTTVCN